MKKSIFVFLSITMLPGFANAIETSHISFTQVPVVGIDPIMQLERYSEAVSVLTGLSPENIESRLVSV